MRVGDFIKKGIVPICIAAALLWIGKGIYLQEEGVNFFALWMLFGIPMGLPYLFVIVPTKWDLSGTIGMIVFCLIIGGLFGGAIAVFLLIRAVIVLIWFPISRLVTYIRN